MIVYLAGDGWEKLWLNDNFYSFNRLNSYVYLKSKEFGAIPKYNNFMLDSGAFTYLNSQKGKAMDWDSFVVGYGELVKAHKIKYFLELDIDPIVGIKEVERLRDLLEKTAGKRCIPVWHKSRGLDYWKWMCKEYDYIAIGGIVTQEIKRSEYDVFLPLLSIARKENCKVHGLGFTNLKGMQKYKFHSVDSTSWLSHKFGIVYYFDGQTIKKQTKKKGQKVITNKTGKNNFYQWVKFSKYAEQNL